jgi:hypothetical protein
MRKDDLYAFFERIDKVHEDEADAIADAWPICSKILTPRN